MPGPGQLCRPSVTRMTNLRCVASSQSSDAADCCKVWPIGVQYDGWTVGLAAASLVLIVDAVLRLGATSSRPPPVQVFGAFGKTVKPNCACVWYAAVTSFSAVFAIDHLVTLSIVPSTIEVERSKSNTTFDDVQ